MRILIAFALALTLGTASGDALAERVQVKSFSGSKRMAKKIRSYVVKIAKKSKSIDGVIKGKVKKRGSSYKIYIRLYDRNGEVTKKFAFRVGRKGLSSKQRRLLRKKLRTAIARLPEKKKPEPEPEPEEDEFSDDDAGDDGDEVADASDDSDSGDSDDGDDDGEDAGVSKSASAGGGAAAGPNGHLYAGLSVVRRSFSFGGDVGNYNGAPAGGASVDASVYPLAFDKKAKGWKPKVGIGVAYQRSVGLKSRFEGGNGEELPTTQSRLAVDARYRMRFGDKARATELVGSVGVERLSFAIDRTNAPAGITIMVPNTSYTSLAPGADLYYPVNAKIALLASVHAKLVMGAGDIVKDTQYGSGSGYGYGFVGGAEYMLTKKVSLRGGLQYDSVGLSFDNNGDLSPMGDFQKSTDSYLGGFVTAGFKL